MCGLVGFVTPCLKIHHILKLATVCCKAAERGRDGFGYFVYGQGVVPKYKVERYATGLTPSDEMTLSRSFLNWNLIDQPVAFIANTRGMPTSEYGKVPKSGHPFSSEDNQWWITHNGTIANDKEILGLDSELIDSQAFAHLLDSNDWLEAVKKIVGSFCFLGIHLQDDVPKIHFATNYKPLWGLEKDNCIIITSQFSYLEDSSALPIANYSYGEFSNKSTKLFPLLSPVEKPKVLVICSGGLDSATVAWDYHCKGLEVHLLHIRYSCKAEGKEVEAIKKLATTMNCQYHIIETNFFLQHADSSLTNDSREINKSRNGISGAEIATEWVPARNLVMISLATAFAEAHDFNIVALGINQEESGAFPDNEQELIFRMNFLRPYVVKPNLQLTYECPVGHMMKHEIVKLGLSLGLPYENTWSCYEGGSEPCSKCGPCFMRQKAFEINCSIDPLIKRE